MIGEVASLLEKWKRPQGLGIFFFFFVGLHFTGRFSFSGRYPVFFPKRPVRPGMTRYLERNETAMFLFRLKYWYGKFRPTGINFLYVINQLFKW